MGIHCSTLFDKSENCQLDGTVCRPADEDRKPPDVL